MLTSISEFVMNLVHIMTLGQRGAEIQFCFVFLLWTLGNTCLAREICPFVMP